MSNKTFDIPVLLIMFNRPETTCHVFDQIRKLRPDKLYIFSEAHRKGEHNEAELVETCRYLVDDSQINWTCDVERWYADTFMGHAIGISSAITWAFETCEKLIVLQDDCLPHPTFFTFCKLMLEKYENNDRVMHISGTRWNQNFDIKHTDHFFSPIGHIWGWATWKRAWSKYDFWMEQFPEMRSQKRIQMLFDDADIASFWNSRLEEVYDEHSKKSWDYQWQYTLFMNYGLAAIPNVNLVSNIGFERASYGIKQLDKHFRQTQAWKNLPGQVDLIIDKKYERNYAINHFFINTGLWSRIFQGFKQMLQSLSVS
ncbi:hypothetical protein [Dyadobacter psychrophilus]|uniref:GNT-I family protein n=1 Tax=Dyadobacter psychrophilus TaxID=651661 RepID=A0A1T5HEQ0_9BACT|nr:hypothetical protein [Dyadobacter psychrophilus]SKC19001.1 hypothetical protein SAMN05660293_05401 [Dyadobacter psychrophilus]